MIVAPELRVRLLTGVLLWTMLIGAGAISGCTASSKASNQATAGTDQTTESTPSFDEPGIYATDSGAELTESELLERLSEKTYVVVGESHGTEWNHRIQKKVYRGLLERRGGSVALGLEMFQRPYQPALDAFVAGDIDEATMLERTEYDERWGVPPRYYRPLWDLAREHRTPIVALNARAELTRAVAKKPLDELSESLRRDLPEDMTLYDEQRRFLQTIFGAHHPGDDDDNSSTGDSAAFERFARAQVVWDATMAETARAFMKEDSAVDAMMIACGRAHSHNAFGIPPRIHASNTDASTDDIATVLPVKITDLERTADDQSASISLNTADAADYIWVSDIRAK